MHKQTTKMKQAFILGFGSLILLYLLVTTINVIISIV